MTKFRTSFGFDVQVVHQNCPGQAADTDDSPRFTAVADPERHGVVERCRNPRDNRESDGTVSLFCEGCGAWLYAEVRPARPSSSEDD